MSGFSFVYLSSSGQQPRHGRNDDGVALHDYSTGVSVQVSISCSSTVVVVMVSVRPP